MTDSSASSDLEDQIDFSVAGVLVRSIFDPAKTGHTTGNVVRHAGRSYALLRPKSGEIGQLPCEHLEPVPAVETRVEAVGSLRLAGPEHLHRAILTEKVRGRLTPVFYSMGTGHAEFYPHQFKPVLKLVSSTCGRILIADEVGLGKTIEAIYVWKEFQARFGCRRLLRCVPFDATAEMASRASQSVRFDANIVNAKELLHQLKRAADDTTVFFVSIGSIEALRAKKPKAESRTGGGGARQRLAAFFRD